MPFSTKYSITHLYLYICVFLCVNDITFRAKIEASQIREFLLKKTDPDANFYETYNGTVLSNKTDVYEFHYSHSDNFTAVRIFTTSEQGSTDFPTIIVIREERSVLSWQIPMLLRYKYEYYDVSRTLCPLDTSLSPKVRVNQTIFVEVSTQSSVSVPYTLRAEMVQHFLINTGEYKSVSSSPSNPVYYLYQFSEGVESVRVIVKSGDKKCATLSIQDTKCPVFDLDMDVEYRGQYQTMTTQGAMAVDKSVLGSSFYIVLVVKSNDDECSGNRGMNQISPATKYRVREKNFTIHIEKTIGSSKYYKATFVSVSFFLGFYLVAVIIGIYYHGCKYGWGIVDPATYERSMSEVEDERRIERPLVETAATNPGYGAVSNSGRTDPDGANVSVGKDNDSVDSLDSGDFDFVRDMESDKDFLRTKPVLFVSDLSKKSEKRTRKKYMLYGKNLLTIAIFYGLPVIQLVMTYQKVLNFTGDQDICYYNFACIHPWGNLSAFNNIFSNIGYVLLGILFLLIVKRREVLRNRAVEQSGGRDKMFGIPQHFGTFYAMGLALCVEGFMSACYHVCPTVSNFQFDTSFMYIMACLCILKIYENRHPDIGAKSHSSFLVMAFIIIVAVIGVVYGTNIFWIVFALVYMTASFILCVHLYYMGRWNLDRYTCKRIFLLFKMDCLTCSKPSYVKRLVLLGFGNIINWSIAIIAVLQGLKDFASYLLGIFIINLLLYTIFYMFLKWWSGEKIAFLTKICIILSMVTWGFSLWFFLAHLTSWQLSPAVSREGNKECILFEFYDHHDVWHFLSAISLFFSFLVILTLDDEIIFERRDKIAVF